MSDFMVLYLAFCIFNIIIIFCDIWMECNSRGISTRSGVDIIAYVIVICVSFVGTIILWVASEEALPYMGKKFSIRWSILFDWVVKDFTLCKKRKKKEK